MIDPFDENPTPQEPDEQRGDEQGEEQPKRQGKPYSPYRKLSNSRKISYSATSTAIAVVMMVITCYLPVTVLPLVMIALCYNIVTERCGVGYGIMTVLASVGIGFLASAANLGILLIVSVVIVPYSVLCYFLRAFDYSTVRTAFVRVIAVAVFAMLCVLFTYLLSALIADFIDVARLVASIGNSEIVGYIIITLTATVLFVCVDLIFLSVSKQIVKRLK